MHLSVMNLRVAILPVALHLAALQLALVPALVCAAPTLTGEQRLAVLERRVAKVTELTVEVDKLSRENRELRGRLETLQYQIDQLKRKQRDIYMDIDQRLSGMAAPTGKPGGPAPVVAHGPAAARVAGETPQSVPDPGNVDVQQMQADYKAAYALLSPAQKRYADAAKAFTAFLENYPQTPLAGNAQYWLAESYYVSQKNEQALGAFRKVVSDYPDSPKVPGSLFKIGRLELALGNRENARKALQQVVDRFPDSPASGLAQDLLGKL